MTKELEPCPFKNDGKAHSPKLITAMGEAWVLCSCGASGKSFSGIDAEEKAIEFWNDRYKRTCKMEYLGDPKSDENTFRVCSKCGAYNIDSEYYSANCHRTVMKFCPFTKEDCRDDCALADVQYTLSDDGIENETFCAFTVIAGYCLNESGDSDD